MRLPVPHRRSQSARIRTLMLWLLCLAGAAASAPANAKSIIWVSQVQSDAGAEFLALLSSQGYTVTERVLTSATLTPDAIAELNAADLVVLSRKAASGQYNTTDWDDITAPMIVMTPYITRSSHWAWFAGTGLVDDTPPQMSIPDASHPLFAGVTVTDGFSEAWHLAIDRGTTFSTDAVDLGGTLLATTLNGATAAAEWPAGTVAAGRRLLLCAGSREANGAAIDTAGKFNLTPLGEKVFLNAARHFAPIDSSDTDGDGVPNLIDAFPNNPAEWEDTDGDTIGNNADPDDDNDLVPDAADQFPKDPAESTDADGDGIGDNADPDRDGDWVANDEDKFPANTNEWDDTDGDGLGDNSDTDADGNGQPDPAVSKIVWVSTVESTTGQEFLDRLTAAGHTVTRFVGTSQTLADTPSLVARVLNTADLVIVSRQVASDQVNTSVWDQVRTPMVVMTPYVLRASRWAWLAGEGLSGETPTTLTLLERGHPLFTGVPHDDAGLTEGWYLPIDRGTSFLGAQDLPGGTPLLVSDTGAIVAAQWPAGTVATGPRLFLAMGSWEAEGAPLDTTGAYNITDTGARVLLNAASLYTTPVPPPSSPFEISSVSYQPDPRQVTLEWPSTPGQTFRVERAAGLAGWATLQDNVPADAPTTRFTDTAPPAAGEPAYYRVIRK